MAKNTTLALYKSRWGRVLVFSIAFIATVLLSNTYVPHPATLFPAVGLSLSFLFIEGIEFWPVVFVAALIANLILGLPLAYLIVGPLAQTIQALVGAGLMRKADIDPLFRRAQDMLFLIGIILITSTILPTFGVLLAHSFPLGPQNANVAWDTRYMGNVLCLLVLTPFFLRWFAKPRFSRTPAEIFETFFIFLLLIGIDMAILFGDLTPFVRSTLFYLMLMPLFWIALRLRPRFVTLALLITSIFTLLGLYIGTRVPPAALFTIDLFQIEEFLIVLAIIFFVMVSIEEDRRLNSNLLRSQVGTLENAMYRIQSESKAKNDFIAILAHELRNPLAPVVTAIDLMKLRHEHEPEEIELLAMMEERMNTVRRLLDDLLDVSRIIEGKISLQKEKTNLTEVVRHAIVSTSHLFKERHQPLVFDVPLEPLYVHGDSVRLEQIFSNLLTNASKYSEAGKQVSLVVSNTTDTATVVVIDRGLGIAAEGIDKIFEPFHQASYTQLNKKGLGIGLALVKAFVDMHDGSVRAESAGPGKGSTFTVTLPINNVEIFPEKNDAPDDRPMFSILPARESHKKTILVVDDNDAAASNLGRLLELKNCVVSYAYDGAQAIRQAIDLVPEIIILDIGLPDRDGYSVAKYLRERGYTGKLIALTGFSTTDAREKGKVAGFDHYLIKPISLNELMSVIQDSK
jgi:signal transduction histidine kinase/CheY-like chemotaxis protein